MSKTLIAVVLAVGASLVIASCAPSADAAVPRSQAQKQKFARTHMCPSTHKYRLPCPGYVIDHIKPLDCGGKDLAENMQWQTIAAGKAKDRVERNGPGCRHPTRNPMVGRAYYLGPVPHRLHVIV